MLGSIIYGCIIYWHLYPLQLQQLGADRYASTGFAGRETILGYSLNDNIYIPVTIVRMEGDDSMIAKWFVVVVVHVKGVWFRNVYTCYVNVWICSFDC